MVIKNKSKIFRIPPNIDYSKKKLVPFFVKKNNMECIGIIYKKRFFKKIRLTLTKEFMKIFSLFLKHIL